MNSLKYTGRKHLAIEFENDDLFVACKAVEPFLERLVLVGGWAFRALMNLPNDERSGKIPYTIDADFAVQLTTKDEYEKITNHLIDSKFKRNKQLPYKFEKEGRFIDILPYGEVASQIIDFNSKEYRLAFDDNDDLILSNTNGENLCLHVISGPSLLVHKIFSLYDKLYEREKDLKHIDYLLERYGSDNEKYGLTVKQKEWLEEKYVEYEMAASHLLGREIQSRLDDNLFIEARARLIKILERIRHTETDESDLSKRMKILLEYFQDKYESFI